MKRRAQSELLEAKQLVARAKAIALCTNKDIANVLGCPEHDVAHTMSPSQNGDHMRVGDLIRLSKDPRMRAFVMEILGGIQANFYLKHLRVCDLENMTTSSTTRDVARSALFEVASQLWPEISADTRE